MKESGKKMPLIWKISIGFIVGIILGFIIGPMASESKIVGGVVLPSLDVIGKIFLAMLKMLIVPLLGDKITTKDGVTFTVLSYTNYKSGGPAVYVEHTPLVPSDAVYFFDIVRINNIQKYEVDSIR